MYVCMYVCSLYTQKLKKLKNYSIEFEDKLTGYS